MPGYKPQVKSESGEMVDIPIAATYDENGNKFDEQYVSIATQTFTEEQKAKARANIGAVSADEAGVKVYYHNLVGKTSRSVAYFAVATNTAEPFTSSSLNKWLKDRGFIVEEAESSGLIGPPNWETGKVYIPPKSSVLLPQLTGMENPIRKIWGIAIFQYSDGSGSAELFYYSDTNAIDYTSSMSVVSDIVSDTI